MRTLLGTSEGLDTQVQGTNDDAQVSKLSCSKAGYFKDDYIQYFVRKSTRRSPLINRGYYSRYAGLRRLLLQFLDLCSGQDCQVLVLGAGYDTTWLQIRDAGWLPSRYVELDFKQVTQKKVATLQQQPALWDRVCAAHSQPQPHSQPRPEGGSPMQQPAGDVCRHQLAQESEDPPPQHHTTHSQQAEQLHSPGCSGMPPPTAHSTQLPPLRARQPLPSHPPPPPPPGMHADAQAGELLSQHYTILPVDLRSPEALRAALTRAKLDPGVPTYILSECVLVYMEPEASNSLLQWLTGYFQNAAVVIYEQIKPEDAFGRQMMSNLEARGCPLRGLPATPSLLDHCRRLRSCGWPLARAWSMDSVYRWHLDPEDKKRVEGLEVFDEFEEWHLIQEHYSISLGIKTPSASSVPGATAPPGQGLEQLGFGGQGCVTA